MCSIIGPSGWVKSELWGTDTGAGEASGKSCERERSGCCVGPRWLTRGVLGRAVCGHGLAGEPRPSQNLRTHLIWKSGLCGHNHVSDLEMK